MFKRVSGPCAKLDPQKPLRFCKGASFVVHLRKLQTSKSQLAVVWCLVSSCPGIPPRALWYRVTLLHHLGYYSDDDECSRANQLIRISTFFLQLPISNISTVTFETDEGSFSESFIIPWAQQKRLRVSIKAYEIRLSVTGPCHRSAQCRIYLIAPFSSLDTPLNCLSPLVIYKIAIKPSFLTAFFGFHQRDLKPQCDRLTLERLEET